MVKEKKEKQGRARRNDPLLGLGTSSNGAEAQTLAETVKSVPVLQLLDSATASEREWACSSLSHMVLDEESLKVLMQNGLIKKLIERLIDPDPQVQMSAAGALRNLASEGDELICSELVKNDIMTPILFLLPKAVDMTQTYNLDPSVENMEKKGIISRFLEQLIVILWCLSEKFEKIIDQINKQDVLLQKLLEILDSKFLSKKSLSVAALNFLNVITEDNADLLKKFQNNPTTCQFFIDFVGKKNDSGDQPEITLIRILGASILFNLQDAVFPVLNRNVLTIVLPIIAQTLKFDNLNALTSLIQNQPHFLAEQGGEEEENETDEKFAEKLAVLGGIGSNLMAQQIALELLTNICSDNDTDDGWEDMEEDGMEEAKAVNMQTTQTSSTSSQNFEIIGNSPIIFQLVTEKAKFLPAEIYQFLQVSSKGKGLLHATNQVQLRAVTCWNNLLMSIDSTKLGNLQQLWDFLFEVALAAPNYPTVDVKELLEAITGTCWALIRQQQINESEIHLNSLKSGSKALIGSETTRINCIGILGILASTTKDLNVCFSITQILIENLGDASLWVVAECLNAFFDIFGEKDKNQVFNQANLFQILKERLPILEKQYKAIPKQERDLRGRIDETLINLKGFIDYKKNEK